MDPKILPRSDISLFDSGPGHSVFMAGAVGSPAKPRQEVDAAAEDAVTAFLVIFKDRIKPI